MKLLLFVQIINVTFAPTLQLCPEFMVSDFLLVYRIDSLDRARSRSTLAIQSINSNM